MAGDSGGGEVAFRITLAAQVKVVVFGPKKPTAVQVPLDPPDCMLQHIAHLAGLEVTKAGKRKLVPLLVPGAIKCDRVEMWVEAEVG